MGLLFGFGVKLDILYNRGQSDYYYSIVNVVCVIQNFEQI